MFYEQTLFSPHSSAALGAMSCVAQHTHSDEISAGGANKPIARHGKLGKEVLDAVMAITNSSHYDSSNQFLTMKICLHRSQMYFQYCPSTEHKGCAVKPQLGQVLFSIRAILPTMSAEQFLENITHDSAPVRTTKRILILVKCDE